MRLLILSSEFPPGPGGIGTHAYQLAKQLNSLGVQVSVLACQDNADRAEIQRFNRQQPFPVIHLHHRQVSFFAALDRMLIVDRWIRSWSAEIVLASGSRSSWIMTLLTRFRSLPWVAVGHGSEFGGRLSLEKKLTRWAFNQAVGVVCVSQFTSQVMHQMGITPRNEIVLANGADAERFSPAEKDTRNEILGGLGLDKTTNILLTVGNMTRRKGQEVVIRALPMVLHRVPKTHYLMVGMPTERSSLEGLSADLGVQSHVHFLGILDGDKFLRIYQACDLFMMTSRKLPDGDSEGFGIAVLEAALCGKPSVVSRGSGLEEAVIDGLTGICVPEDDPEKTADAIIQLLENSKLRLSMGEQARTHACQGSTWRIVGEHYYNFLQEILGNWKKQ